MYSRVRQIDSSGQNHQIVDPDLGLCYTRQLKSKCQKCSREGQNSSTSTQSESQLPSDGWTTSLTNIPKSFSYVKILEHAKKSGKLFSNAPSKSSESYIERPLSKGYKFFFENYVHNVTCNTHDGCCSIKGKCHRSQRKSEAPHSITVSLKSDSGDVLTSSCSCIAG